MTTKFILQIYLLLVCPIFLYGQENNNWHFGNQATMNFGFPSSSVVSTGGGSNININEGTASISNSSGTLLFYTNGQIIWNANNLPMAEQAGLPAGLLSGHPSSTSSAIIVPEPGVSPNTSTNRYYVFTVPSAELIQQQPSSRIKYSIVSFAINPLGQIVVKNQDLPLSPGESYVTKTEKIAAARTCDGLGFWIVTHDHNSATFRSYLLTNSGINASNNVVSSTTGIPKTYRGYMRISPDNQRIGFADLDLGIFIYDFNSSTGQVSVSNGSELSNLPIYPGLGDVGLGSKITYGVEFSPNSQILYFSSMKRGVYAYNITTGVTTHIYQITSSTQNQTVGALSLGPDGQIYVARWTTPAAMNNWWTPTPGAFISRINNPNTVSASNYTFNALSFPSSSGCLYGLPTTIPNYIFTGPQILAQDSIICNGDSTVLTASGLQNYIWTPTAGLNQSTGSIVTVNPLVTTNYTVSGLNSLGCVSTNSITVVVDTNCCNQPPVFTTNNLTHCYNDIIVFPDGTSAVAISDTVQVSNVLTINGCDSSITTNILVLDDLSQNIDTSICSGTDYSFPDGVTHFAITASETYVSSFIGASGCDSLITTNINVVANMIQTIDTSICSATDYVFPDGVSHFNITENETYSVFTTGTNGCVSETVTNLFVVEIPNPQIISDSIICEGKTIILNPGTSGDYSIWSTGETTNVIYVQQAGMFSVMIVNACGQGSDTVQIETQDCDCSVYIPNSFTPNGDESNPTFGPVYYCDIDQYEMILFNRWGEIIFQSQNIDEKWDGTYSGKVVPNGVYTYRVTYTPTNNQKIAIDGHLNVLQ